MFGRSVEWVSWAGAAPNDESRRGTAKSEARMGRASHGETGHTFSSLEWINPRSGSQTSRSARKPIVRTGDRPQACDPFDLKRGRSCANRKNQWERGISYNDT